MRDCHCVCIWRFLGYGFFGDRDLRLDGVGFQVGCFRVTIQGLGRKILVPRDPLLGFKASVGSGADLGICPVVNDDPNP